MAGHKEWVDGSGREGEDGSVMAIESVWALAIGQRAAWWPQGVGGSGRRTTESTVGQQTGSERC